MKKVITIITLAILFIAFGCQKPDASKELKPIVDKYIEALNTGNLDILDEIVDKQLIQHTTSIYESDVLTIDTLKNGILWVRKTFPDFHINVEDEIYMDNKSTIRYTWTGTYTDSNNLHANGKKVELTEFESYNFKEGKIIDIWRVANFLALEGQLGYTLTPVIADSPDSGSK